jgi:hypothetical protein
MTLVNSGPTSLGYGSQVQDGKQIMPTKHFLIAWVGCFAVGFILTFALF